MYPSELAPEGFQLSGLDAARLEQLIELIFPGELAHPDRVLNDASGSCKACLAVQPAYRADTEIELGGKAAIQPNLLVA